MNLYDTTILLAKKYIYTLRKMFIFEIILFITEDSTTQHHLITVEILFLFKTL